MSILPDRRSFHTPEIEQHYQRLREQLGQLQTGSHRWRFEASFTYERDLLGRISAQTQSGPGGRSEHRYRYDNAGRLIAHSHNGHTTDWQYDPNGNRTHENGQLIATYNSQDQLLSWKDNTYTYDSAGQLQSKTTARGTSAYTYDSLGQLRQVSLPNGQSIEYAIDPLGRRIGKSKNGQRQYGLIYQDNLRPIADTDENGDLKTLYIYADKPHSPSAMIRAGKTYQIISDHLGSVRLVIDNRNRPHYPTNGLRHVGRSHPQQQP